MSSWPDIRKLLLLGHTYHRQHWTTYQNWRRCRTAFRVGTLSSWGDLNADIGRLRNPWDQQVAAFLELFGLVDLLVHFQQHLCYRHIQMWWQVHQGRVLQSWCDYVLGLDRRIFETIGIQTPGTSRPKILPSGNSCYDNLPIVTRDNCNDAAPFHYCYQI